MVRGMEFMVTEVGEMRVGQVVSSVVIVGAVLLAMPAQAELLWGAKLLERASEGQIRRASYGVLAKNQNWFTSAVINGDFETGSGKACCEASSLESCHCKPLWKHRGGVFAEFLFLRPGNVDVVYATEQTSFDPTLASPTGPVGRVNVDRGTGFRIGAGWGLNDCTSVVATYSWLESDTENTINAVPGNIMNLEVGHPSLITSGAPSNTASAFYDLDFQLLDLDYRSLLWGNRDAALNYLVGLRYGHLSQDFLAEQEIFSAAGLTNVSSEIDFDGFGIRFGLDGMKRRAGTGMLLYAKGQASFVSGEFKANFVQANQFGGAAVIGNDFEDYRIVSILDAELGLGWESAGGRLRVTGGYLVSGWFNTLTTATYIEGVQSGDFAEMAETLTFDGLVGRLELRY